MSDAQFQQMKVGQGFIAALDQSGGSTPKALKLYGIDEDQYSDDDEMFTLMHTMRKRIIESPSFNANDIIGAILFEDTMDREIAGRRSASFLWDMKRVVPFLKIDKGLAPRARRRPTDESHLRPRSPALTAKEQGVFGTKMRSFIKQASPAGIKAVIDQQI